MAKTTTGLRLFILDGSNSVRPDVPATPRFTLDTVFDPALWGGFTAGPYDIANLYTGDQVPCERNQRVKLKFPGDDKIVEGDAQGYELRYAQAKYFERVDSRFAHPFNQAILAFIDKLPSDTPVVLYWS